MIELLLYATLAFAVFLGARGTLTFALGYGAWLLWGDK